MNKLYFTIEGDKVSGRYVVVEWNNGNSKKILEIKGRHLRRGKRSQTNDRRIFKEKRAPT